MPCRICLEEEGPFVHPCSCKGSAGDVHAECLTKWVEASGNKKCEICHSHYTKKDAFSFNPNRFCKQFVSCHITDSEPRFYRKIAGLIFGMSCLTLIFIDPDYMLISCACSTLLISCLCFSYALQPLKNTSEIYNAALIWKLSYSLPFFLNILILNTTYKENCNLQCITMHQSCDPNCPVYDQYDSKTNYLASLFVYDLILVAIVFVIRAIMMCYFHMRRLKFHDFNEESVPLLSDEEP